MSAESFIAQAEADIASLAPQAFAEAIARLAAAGTPHRPFGPDTTPSPAPARIGIARIDDAGGLTGELRGVAFAGTRQADGTYALTEADVA